jgi:PAS domain S-box-containing protein
VEDLADLLERDSELFRRFFQDSTEAIVITDTQGRIALANEAWLRIYGYRMEEVRGATTSIIKSPQTPHEMYEFMWTQISDPEKGSWKGEIVNRTRTGEDVPILLTITPIRSAGSIIGYAGIGIDISERKQTEAMKEMLDLVIRHDLKAPLGSLIALLHVMNEGLADPLTERQKGIVARSMRIADRMQQMIAVSLDIEKLRRGALDLEISDVDLIQVARESIETLRELAESRGVTLDLRVGDGEPRPDDRLSLSLDPVHVQRCSDNLLKNAIEASPRGERVVVRVQRRDEEVEFGVHNGGPPIPPQVRATLFHAFSTYGKRGGTGLGLYGVKLATEAMGGKVTYGTGDGGTSFVLRFPA